MGRCKVHAKQTQNSGKAVAMQRDKADEGHRQGRSKAKTRKRQELGHFFKTSRRNF